MDVRQCTEHLNEARFFNDNELEEAEDICLNELNDSFKIYPVCPVCNLEFSEPPALSRKDNKTKICSICGYKEALTDFIKNKRE